MKRYQPHHHQVAKDNNRSKHVREDYCANGGIDGHNNQIREGPRALFKYIDVFRKHVYQLGLTVSQNLLEFLRFFSPFSIVFMNTPINALVLNPNFSPQPQLRDIFKNPSLYSRLYEPIVVVDMTVVVIPNVYGHEPRGVEREEHDHPIP